jgi:hypothetical protein
MPRRKGEVVEKGAPIVIPNAESLTPEELAREKKREKQRRYMARRDYGTAIEKKPKAEVRTMQHDELVELAKETRNTTLVALQQAIQNILADPEKLAKTNIVHLATVFGIMTEKSQLLSGLATEHIAIHAKIDVNMPSEKALEELNRMRERYAEQS